MRLIRSSHLTFRLLLYYCSRFRKLIFGRKLKLNQNLPLQDRKYYLLENFPSKDTLQASLRQCVTSSRRAFIFPNASLVGMNHLLKCVSWSNMSLCLTYELYFVVNSYIYNILFFVYALKGKIKRSSLIKLRFWICTLKIFFNLFFNAQAPGSPGMATGPVLRRFSLSLES